MTSYSSGLDPSLWLVLLGHFWGSPSSEQHHCFCTIYILIQHACTEFSMCPLRILWIYIYIIFPFLYLAPAFFLRSRQISNCPRLYQMDYPTISSASAQNQAQTYNFLHEPLLVLPMFSFPEAREPGNFQGPVCSTWKFLLFSFSSFKQ